MACAQNLDDGLRYQGHGRILLLRLTAEDGDVRPLERAVREESVHAGDVNAVASAHRTGEAANRSLNPINGPLMAQRGMRLPDSQASHDLQPDSPVVRLLQQPKDFRRDNRTRHDYARSKLFACLNPF
jgi:hypothetical protein